MPALFSLGHHRALEAVRTRLRPGERLDAYLDDIYVICLPERVTAVYAVLEEELWRHSRIQINMGKTRVWNRAGEKPQHCDSLGLEPWKRASELPLEEQGVKV